MTLNRKKLITGNYLALLFLLTFTTYGQQNLFNVPSSDLTLKGEPFFQQQINLVKGEIQFNTTFDWGIGHRTEIGFNILSVDVNTSGQGPTFITNSEKSNPPTYPLYLVNLQKAVVLNTNFKIGLGTQTGFSKDGTFADYTYLNLVTALPKTHTKIITGIYYGTDSFLGSETRNRLIPSLDPIGFQFGIEEQLIPEKFSVIVESISGTHSLGESSAGLAYFLNENWIVSSAFQLANTHNKDQNALVMELTYCPSAKVHLKLFRHGHQQRTS